MNVQGGLERSVGGFDRGTAQRRGLTKEQWLDQWATSQKALVKWAGIPILAIWFLCAFWMIGLAVAK
jgi:hypothetical protein